MTAVATPMKSWVRHQVLHGSPRAPRYRAIEWRVDENPVMACSLTAGEARTRAAEIEYLFRDGLERCDRGDRELRLTFRLPDVDELALTDLVARERECCPFLDFELSKSAGRLVLVIGAPPGAGPALDVFQEFATGRAQMPSSGSCC